MEVVPCPITLNKRTRISESVCVTATGVVPWIGVLYGLTGGDEAAAARSVWALTHCYQADTCGCGECFEVAVLIQSNCTGKVTECRVTSPSPPPAFGAPIGWWLRGTGSAFGDANHGACKTRTAPEMWAYDGGVHFCWYMQYAGGQGIVVVLLISRHLWDCAVSGGKCCGHGKAGGTVS
jgi:hypothetical protein